MYGSLIEIKKFGALPRMLKPSILHSIVSLCGEEEAIGVFIDVCPSIEEAAHYRFRQMIHLLRQFHAFVTNSQGSGCGCWGMRGCGELGDVRWTVEREMLSVFDNCRALRHVLCKGSIQTLALADVPLREKAYPIIKPYGKYD
jgi:hypothetical protein